MKELILGKVKTHNFSNFLILGLSKKWLGINCDKPIEFEAKIVEGNVVLSAKLERLERTKDVVKNEM